MLPVIFNLEVEQYPRLVASCRFPAPRVLEEEPAVAGAHPEQREAHPAQEIIILVLVVLLIKNCHFQHLRDVLNIAGKKQGRGISME